MAVTLPGILQESFAAYTEAHKAPRRVWKAAQAVMTCRTAALGGHVRGGPLKEHRLVVCDGQQVTFRYGNHRELDAQGKP